MQSAKQILADIYTSKEFEDMMTKYRHESLRDDMKQYIILQMLEKPETLIIELHNKGRLKEYICRVFWNTTRMSKYNKFTKEAKLFEPLPGNVEEIESEAPDSLKIDLSGIYWYKARILEKYAEMGSYKAVSDDTGIPVSSIFRTVQQARKAYKQKI